jgi:hypothetical protein
MDRREFFEKFGPLVTELLHDTLETGVEIAPRIARLPSLHNDARTIIDGLDNSSAPSGKLAVIVNDIRAAETACFQATLDTLKEVENLKQATRIPPSPKPGDTLKAEKIKAVTGLAQVHIAFVSVTAIIAALSIVEQYLALLEVYTEHETPLTPLKNAAKKLGKVLGEVGVDSLVPGALLAKRLVVLADEIAHRIQVLKEQRAAGAKNFDTNLVLQEGLDEIAQAYVLSAQLSHSSEQEIRDIRQDLKTDIDTILQQP